jgi:anti-sigma factor RsiW
MFDENHNFNGDHGVELLSYMYGELEPDARGRFESHLAACEECAFELASFADARLGVIEWKRDDFDHLASPVILIPEAARRQFAPARQQGSPAGSGGLLESISSWAALTRLGTGLAAAVVFAGIVYFGYIGSISEQRAFVAPVETASEDRPGIVDPPFASSKTRENKSEAKVTAPNQHNMAGTARKGTKPAQVASIRTTRQSANLRVTAVRAQPVTAKAPRLNNFDEYEDKTLRLADLLADIGGSEDE